MDGIYAAWLPRKGFMPLTDTSNNGAPEVGEPSTLEPYYAAYSLQRRSDVLIKYSEKYRLITRIAQQALDGGAARVLLSTERLTPFDLEILR